MKKLFNWFAPLLIGALVAPGFVACEGLEGLDGDKDNPGDGNGNGDIVVPSTALKPDAQKVMLQQIAVDAMNSIDVNSTKPALDAIDYLTERIRDVEELPWQFEMLFEALTDDNDYEVYPDEPDMTDSVVYSKDPIAMLSDIASLDMTALTRFSTKANEIYDIWGMTTDYYGDYTLTPDNTWTENEATGPYLSATIDGYTLKFEIGGKSTILVPDQFTGGGDLDVIAPTQFSISITKDGAPIIAVAANATSYDLTQYNVAANASASFADFAMTFVASTSNGPCSAAGKLTYKGSPIADVTVAANDFDFEESFENEELTATGGITASTKFFNGALCIDGAVTDLASYIEDINSVEWDYVYDDDDVTDAEGNTTYTQTYYHGKESNEATTAALNKYVDIKWGFGSTALAQGTIEFFTEESLSTHREESIDDDLYDVPHRTWIYNDYNYSPMPLLVFGDGSKIEFESFFTKDAFKNAINSADELMDEMMELVSQYDSLN